MHLVEKPSTYASDMFYARVGSQTVDCQRSEGNATVRRVGLKFPDILAVVAVVRSYVCVCVR